MKSTAALVALFALALAPSGCKSSKPTQTPSPDDTTAPEPSEAADPEVPQEPDPPALAEASEAYLAGHNATAQQILDPLLSDLQTRQQWRASGLAAGWLALLHADQVFEHAREPATYAMQMAEKTNDPEVDAMAALAWGAYLLGNQDYDAAVQSLEQAVTHGEGTRIGVVAQLRLAEALINRAFGRLGEELEHPEDLERARQAYRDAGTAALRLEGDNPAVLGRVEEGKAALADFRKQKAEVCAHAVAAFEHYGKAQASEDRLFLPEKLMESYKCPRPRETGGSQ